MAEVAKSPLVEFYSIIFNRKLIMDNNVSDRVIYVHKRGTTGVPFYIGRGSMERAKNLSPRSKRWSEVYDECGIEILILEDGLTVEESKLKEAEYISKYRTLYGDEIINFSMGGDAGPSVGVRVFYNVTLGVYFAIAGTSSLANYGFDFNKVQAVCRGSVKTTHSEFMRVNGKPIRFNVRYFPNGSYSELVEEYNLIWIDPNELFAEIPGCIVSQYSGKNYFIYYHEEHWAGIDIEKYDGCETDGNTIEVEEVIDRRCIFENFGIFSFQFPHEKFYARCLLETGSHEWMISCEVVGIDSDVISVKLKFRTLVGP